MLKETVLIWKFRRGHPDALALIYQEYLDDLLTLAMAMVNDAALAEDIVHDVFVALAKRQSDFRLQHKLKSYLVTCVMNRARDMFRVAKRHQHKLEHWSSDHTDHPAADARVMGTERAYLLNQALALLPHVQRETVALHVKAGMRFTEIAKMQEISVNTVRGRYRYGLKKLRVLLADQVTL
jgi:RNA polymerase sigma-70 factor (ECF subfamily)